MITIQLDRERYPQHGEIWRWLEDNVGTGGAWQETMVEEHLWDWYVVFGHARVRFRHREHAAMFGMVWS